MRRNRIISPQMVAYNKAALIMAYKLGATDDNAREVANKFRIIDIENFIRELVRKETK